MPKENKSLKLFQDKAKEFESAYEEFDAFYDQFKNFFSKDFSAQELEIVKNIREIVSQLDGNGNPDAFRKWGGDTLSRAEFRLANFLLPLGEITNQKVQRANAMGRWVKWKRFNEWSPAKEALELKLESEAKEGEKVGKVYKDEVENEVGKKIFAESMIEAFMSGHADYLLSIHDSVKSILVALAHRINLKRDEKPLNRKQ